MRKSIIGLLLSVLLISLFLVGCTNQKKDSAYDIYYLNMDATKIIPESYEPSGNSTTSLIAEFLDKLSEDPDKNEVRRVIPKDVSVNGYSFNGYLLSIDFGEAYYDMTSTEEVLTRAAIVRTLLQIEDISYVNFTVNSAPLVDAEDKVVGSMDNESFVENPGAQINKSLSTTLTLYFATSDGTKLKKETREAHYSSNISMEKLVMEQLLEGPKTKGLQSAIPSETKLITVSIADNVCYVNLDETFRNQKDEIAEPVVLYSIVNSLSELPNVKKVQISINGDTKGKCRYTYDLATLYEPDESYVEIDEEETEQVESSTEKNSSEMK